MKKLIIIFPALCALFFFSACKKDENSCNCGHTNTIIDTIIIEPPINEPTAEELILGSWKVTNNSFTVNGESMYDWDNTLVGQYWKFCSNEVSDGSGGDGYLFINGAHKSPYIVIGDRIYFTYTLFSINNNVFTFKRFTIDSISATKLILTNDGAYGSADENITHMAIELDRL